VRLYLDTNVLAFICERGEEDEVSAWLANEGHTVVLSDAHLTETLPTSDAPTRNARLRLMHRLMSETPQFAPFLLAQELLDEIERCRPRWLKQRPDTSRVSVWLNRHRRRFQALRHPPAWLTEGSDRALSITELGIEQDRQTQKQLRRIRHGESKAIRLGGREYRLDDIDTTDPLGECRATWLGHWHKTLYSCHPGLRDFRDFARPYLRMAAIPRDELAALFLEEIDPRQMPRALSVSVAGPRSSTTKSRAGTCSTPWTRVSRLMRIGS